MTIVRAFQPLSAGTSVADYRAAAVLYTAANGFPDKSLEHWRYSAARFAAAVNAPANAESVGAASALPPLPYAATCVHTIKNPVDAMHVRTVKDSDTAPTGGFLDAAHAAHVSAHTDVTAVDITASLEKPLLIERGAEKHHSLMLRVSAGVSVTLIERIAPESGARYRSGFTDVILEKGASLTHYTIAETGAGVTRYDSLRVVQHDGSRYHAAMCVTGNGGAFKRDSDVQLIEENAENRQYIIHAVGGDAICDHYLPVSHIAPNCKSFQRARYAPTDKAACVYYGRASAAQEAIGTEAHQLNKNMLLSPTAKVYSRPELDILTNEIICSHGSATGGIDDNALYYLQQRGIANQQALTMLTAAFLQMDKEAAPDDALRAYINSIIAAR